MDVYLSENRRIEVDQQIFSNSCFKELEESKYIENCSGFAAGELAILMTT